ncbi:hypothetical protein [Paenibacillus tyrfis]|uniref:hypothetical protein n=1 Tax=Paenibacillus tyrfis TaxID=1501230 RepID=UPI000B59006E|nr:hypothetical protein [Paenibacillus tyrfis]
MNKYEIQAEEYFRSMNAEPEFKIVQEAMEQLIEKYELADRSVLCIAPGNGIEEYWFHRHGCELTFVDIDQYGSIEPGLKSYTADAPSRTLTYYISDAAQFAAKAERTYEALYISGITNDECRRRSILDKHSVWPSNEKPYLDFVTALAGRNLKPGGLFIYQSYYGGVDALYNKHYTGLLKKHLGEAGVHLLHYYVFNAAHSVSLTVGLKGSGQEADDYMRRIKHRPELTLFHGRSELNRQGIRKVYDRVDGIQ